MLARQGHQRAHRGRRAALPTDDASEIAWCHVNVEHLRAAVFGLDDMDVGRPIRQRTRDDLDDPAQLAHGAGDSDAAGAGASADGGADAAVSVTEAGAVSAAGAGPSP